MKKNDPDTYDAAESQRRFEATLKGALSLPHTPHAKDKAAPKPKKKPKDSASTAT